MKRTPFRILLPLCLALLATPLQARENAYDVLGKTLEPLLNVLSPKAPLHALVLDAHLVKASKLPPEFQGQSVHLALRAPDRLLIRAPFSGEMITLCRNEDDLWATPGSKIQYLIDQLAPAGADDSAATTPAPDDATGKPKKKKKHHDEAAAVLGPLQLPIPQKELVFLPVLFEVADVGDDEVGGVPCRVMDVQLMQQLEKSLHAEGWRARLWVGPNYQIAQITLAGPQWSATLAIDKTTITETLPPDDFQPAGQDALHLTPAQFLHLAEQLGSK